ncbi:CpaF family protein [Flindersiella endophytica]
MVEHTTPRSIVREIVGRVADPLSERLDGAAVAGPDHRQYARDVIRREVTAWSDRQARTNGREPTPAFEQMLAEAVDAELFGVGPFQPMLNDEAVENIDVHGCDQVWVTRRTATGGERVPGAPVADSDAELVELLQQLASREGQRDRSFTRANPKLDLRLPDGSRLAAKNWTTPRPVVSIRRHRVRNVTLSNLVEFGTVSRTLAEFLAAAVRARRNIVVTGMPNAGKTTLLRAMAAEIHPMERFATIEKEYELHLHEDDRHLQVVAMEGREGTADGCGAVTLTELLTDALRFNLTRIIVGEVRSDEIVAMLDAMTTGSGGSMCTMHARSARDAIHRMHTLCTRWSPGMSSPAAYALIASAVDLIVHLDLMDRSYQGGGIDRYVAEVLEVHDVAENGRPSSTMVFGPGPDGRAVPQHRPSFQPELVNAGFEPSLLDTQLGNGFTEVSP